MKTLLASLLASLTLAACADTTVPDLNNSSVSGFSGAPNGSGAGALAVGLIRGARDNDAQIVATIGPFGREGYEMSAARGDILDYLTGPLTPGTFYVQQNWIGQYADVKAAYLILDNLSAISDLTATQKQAMTGFVQTMMAYDFELLAETRDTLGLPIAVDINPTGTPAPIATKAQVYQHILNLLDSAQTALNAGGPAFSFTLPPGFAAFSTPATFLTFNRALRARADILLNNWNDALTDLGASFLSTSAPLSTGPSFDFTENSGDEVNPLFQPYYFSDTLLYTNCQHQPGGACDQRILNKTDVMAPTPLAGLSMDRGFLLYQSPNASLPVIRNEELILMRAEANIGLGQYAAALPDLNLIRTTSGDLAPATSGSFATPNDWLEELLYEKRYSLLWEGGHNWIDMRHYGKLGEINKELSTSHIFTVMPFPLTECQARSPEPAGCVSVVGL
jgi:starch-binding outer membrane protein, SusD/RagB family